MLPDSRRSEKYEYNTHASPKRTTIFSGGMSALAAISGSVKALSTAAATSFLTAAVRHAYQ